MQVYYLVHSVCLGTAALWKEALKLWVSEPGTDGNRSKMISITSGVFETVDYIITWDHLIEHLLLVHLVSPYLMMDLVTQFLDQPLQ